MSRLISFVLMVIQKDVSYLDDVSMNSFDCVFVHKETRCASKTKIKERLQYAIKKTSLPDDMIIYTPEDVVMN